MKKREREAMGKYLGSAQLFPFSRALGRGRPGSPTSPGPLVAVPAAGRAPRTREEQRDGVSSRPPGARVPPSTRGSGPYPLCDAQNDL